MIKSHQHQASSTAATAAVGSPPLVIEESHSNVSTTAAALPSSSVRTSSTSDNHEKSPILEANSANLRDNMEKVANNHQDNYYNNKRSRSDAGLKSPSPPEQLSVTLPSSYPMHGTERLASDVSDNRSSNVQEDQRDNGAGQCHSSPPPAVKSSLASKPRSPSPTLLVFDSDNDDCGKAPLYASTTAERHNWGPWTSKEITAFDLALNLYGKDWDRISVYLGSRTNSACKAYYYVHHPQHKRQRKLSSALNHWARWTKNEKEAFDRAFILYGNKWGKISAYLGSRDSRSCKAYFKRNPHRLRSKPSHPHMQQTKMLMFKPWTEEEKDAFHQAFNSYGRDWDKISAHIGTRTNDACRNYYYLQRKPNSPQNTEEVMKTTSGDQQEKDSLVTKKGSFTECQLNQNCSPMEFEIGREYSKWTSCWSDEEKSIFDLAYKKHGEDYRAIAKYLPGKSYRELTGYYLLSYKQKKEEYSTSASKESIVGQRICMYFETVNDPNKMKLFFGSITSFSPASNTQDKVDLWEVTFDDGDVADYENEDIQASLEVYEANKEKDVYKPAPIDNRSLCHSVAEPEPDGEASEAAVVFEFAFRDEAGSKHKHSELVDDHSKLFETVYKSAFQAMYQKNMIPISLLEAVVKKQKVLKFKHAYWNEIEADQVKALTISAVIHSFDPTERPAKIEILITDPLKEQNELNNNIRTNVFDML